MVVQRKKDSMTKLHQILAVERDVKQSTNRHITDGYQMLQKPALLQGLARVYRARDEADTELLPPENQRVQVRATEVLKASQSQFERLWDITATKDWANLGATADVKLADGTTLIEGAPVTYLMWLEKQLTDIKTIVSKLPILDATEEWVWSAAQDCYMTETHETHRTKKLPRVLVKAKATDKHPEQVDVFSEDVIVGYWSTTKFSAALPATQVRELLDRVLAVTEAVKTARSTANEVEITQQKVAGPVLTYIFGAS